MLHLLLQHILWFMIRSLLATYQITVLKLENRDKARSSNPLHAYIFAVWHEQVVSVMSGHAWTLPYLTLSSRSKDGDYAAFVAAKMGFIAVRGSSRKKNKDKGGKEAMQLYIQKIQEGFSGGLTVDGPKGPRQVCKPGVALIAQETGIPILPVIGLASKFWEFNSWDRFKIPKPFAKVFLVYGEPVYVPKNAGREEIDLICQKISQDLKDLEAENISLLRA